MAMKIVPWLVLLIALNLLLELLGVYGANAISAWITFVIVAVIGLLMVAEKK